MSEGRVEFAVPGFIRPFLRLRHLDLCLTRIDQPGSAEQAVGAVGEDLEAQDIDRDIAVVQVADNPRVVLASIEAATTTI